MANHPGKPGGQRTATLHPLPGEYSAVEPPDPIPNSEVKRSRADGSVLRACESRSSPGPYTKTPNLVLGVFLCPNKTRRHPTRKPARKDFGAQTDPLRRQMRQHTTKSHTTAPSPDARTASKARNHAAQKSGIARMRQVWDGFHIPFAQICNVRMNSASCAEPFCDSAIRTFSPAASNFRLSSGANGRWSSARLERVWSAQCLRPEWRPRLR